MIRIGRFGKFSCATTGAQKRIENSAAANDRIIMGVPLFRSFVFSVQMP
jgi:hypothetical protein